MLKLPKVIGHRGAKAYAPENTLAAIHVAADLGIEWVEIDVKLTKDGTAIIFHDDELDRCTNMSGLVAHTDWQTICELDAGTWFSESFMGERIPTLEQALDVILERNLGVNLEIKPCPGREKDTAEVMMDIASRIWPDDKPPPLVSSFSHVSLESALDMLPEWPRGLLMEDQLENWKEIADYLQAATINIDGRKASREEIEDYIDTRRPVMAYTINDPLLAQNLIRWGVDSVFSDCPDTIREALETFN